MECNDDGSDVKRVVERRSYSRFDVWSVPWSCYCGFAWGASAEGDRGPQTPSNFSNFIFRAMTPLSFDPITMAIAMHVSLETSISYRITPPCRLKDQSDERGCFHSIDSPWGPTRHDRAFRQALLYVLSHAIVRKGVACLESQPSHTKIANATSGQISSARTPFHFVLSISIIQASYARWSLFFPSLQLYVVTFSPNFLL